MAATTRHYNPCTAGAGWRPGLRLTAVVAGLSFIAFVVGGLGYRAIEARQQALDVAMRTNEALARTLAEHALGTLRGVDEALIGIADAVTRMPEAGAPGDWRIVEWLNRRLTFLPQVRSIIVTDANGRLLHDSETTRPQRLDLSGQEYFAVPRDDREQGLYVGRPLPDRDSGRWMLPASRALTDAHGNFAGIVLAIVEPYHFADFYASIAPAAAVLTLMHSDGTLIARHPRHEEAVGQLAGISFFWEQPGRRSADTLWLSARTGDQAQLISYRTLDSPPLVVAVRSSSADILAAWRRDFSDQAVLVSLACFGIALLTLAVLRQIRQREDSERRLADFAEISSDWLWETDRELRFIYISERIETVVGVAPAALLGRRRAEIGASDPDIDWARHKDDLAHRRPFRDFVYPYRRDDGTVRYFRVSGKPVFDRAGNFVGYRGAGSDVTAMREAEARLRHSEHELRVFFEQAPIGMAIIAIDGTIRRANPAFAAMLGYAAHEIEGRGGGTFTHPEDIAAALAAQKKLLGGGIDTLTLENRFRHRDGAVLHCLVTLSPVRNGSGQPTHLIAQVVDITARKQAEEQLRNAKEEAELSSRAKTEFLANMSHELRTPLNAIIGFAEMIEQQILGPVQPAKYRSYAGDIHSSGVHLLTLINDILDLSRIEAGKVDLQPQDFDLRELCEEAFKLVELRAQRDGIMLKLQLPEAPLRLRADRRAALQVLLNLLSNAIKFTPETGNVTLSAVPRGQRCALSVADTGIGIPGDALQRLGRPFEQVDNVFNRRREGSGLGLAVCRRLVEMHGGRVVIASRLGAGTTVTADLPLAPVLQARAAGS
jgi:PAS domain S-box-containing protein